jgi:hypothetical protein
MTKQEREVLYIQQFSRLVKQFCQSLLGEGVGGLGGGGGYYVSDTILHVFSFRAQKQTQLTATEIDS